MKQQLILGDPDEQFWEKWKTDKQSLKKLGYSVKRFDNQWKVVYNPKS